MIRFISINLKHLIIIPYVARSPSVWVIDIILSMIPNGELGYFTCITVIINIEINVNNNYIIKKTCRLASPAFGRKQRRSCTYTLFLKFLPTSNLLARNLYSLWLLYLYYFYIVWTGNYIAFNLLILMLITKLIILLILYLIIVLSPILSFFLLKFVVYFWINKIHQLMVDVLLCRGPHPPNNRFKKGMCCLLLFNRQPIRFYNNSIINGTGDMSSMTIKMKMAQDELILSGV
jgi:hypothetical protein